MTDLITKARKEWCEPPASETTLTHYGTKIIVTPKGSSCPPSVVAALLDVLEGEIYNDYCCICGEHTSWHKHGCRVTVAEAAITRALEGK